MRITRQGKNGHGSQQILIRQKEKANAKTFFVKETYSPDKCCR